MHRVLIGGAVASLNSIPSATGLTNSVQTVQHKFDNPPVRIKVTRTK